MHPSPSSFTNLESSRRGERAGEIGFLFRALPVVLWLTFVHLGPVASQPIELYRFGIVST